MYGAAETSTGVTTLAATGVALTTGSAIAIAIAIAVIALGGLLLALRKRYLNRRGPKP